MLGRHYLGLLIAKAFYRHQSATVSLYTTKAANGVGEGYPEIVCTRICLPSAFKLEVDFERVDKTVPSDISYSLTHNKLWLRTSDYFFVSPIAISQKQRSTIVNSKQEGPDLSSDAENKNYFFNSFLFPPRLVFLVYLILLS